MAKATPSLIRPQAEFLSLPHKFRAYVGGYGSGKTWGGSAILCRHAWEFPRVPLGYFAPTYGDVKDTFFPTIEEVATDWGLRCAIRSGNKEVHLFSGRVYRTTIVCRSMSDPSAIKGFKIGRALVDEIDLLSADDAASAWRKIIARLRVRYARANGADVTTTPEGYRFTYRQFSRAVRDDNAAEQPVGLAKLYGLIQASTRENERFLPPDYIDSLLATYPDQLIAAYIEGQFVNLASGTVYRAYNRELNRSTETIREGETVRIGMDFNVGKMAAVTHVLRDEIPHAVEEIMGRLDTPDMIDAIKARYWEFDEDRGEFERTREIYIYPDSTGGSRKTTNASITDIQLLRGAGFKVSAPKANPPVRNRVNAMNARFCAATGERRYFVNDAACPTYADALEQQAYNDQGEPDKTQDQDHPNDAAGYFIHRDFPVVRPVRKLDIRTAI